MIAPNDKSTDLALSVVVPVRNEAGNIGPLVDEIYAALDGVARFEVIYVDDGSTDTTAAELIAARAKHNSLRILTLGESVGQSFAFLSGIRAARAPFIVTLDGDGQNDPASIPAMWARMTEKGAPDSQLMICGHRKNRRDTLWRRFASRCGNGIRRGLLRDATPDSGCALKIFARAAFLDLPRFDHMHRFLPPLFLHQGLDVISVEVNHRPRERGVSKYGVLDRLWDGIWDLMGVVWLIRRTKYPRITKED